MRQTGDILGGIVAPMVTGRPSHVCPYCGATVEHRSAELLGRVVYRPSRCSCEQERVEREDKAVADRERDLRVQKHLAESGLHTGLKDRSVSMRFSTFERDFQPEAYEAARRFAHFAEGWSVLILSGGYGTGKTHLAAAAVRVFCMRDRSGRFVDVPGLRRQLTATFNREKPGVTEDSILQSYGEAGVLALDDWGAEATRSDWFDGAMFSLVNARYTAQLPLVVTTNKDRGEFGRWVGQRLASRIAEGSTWVGMRPRDYRMEKKARSSEP